MAGKIIQNVSFSVKNAGIANIQLDLLTDIRRGQLSFQNDRIVGALDDMTIGARIELKDLSKIQARVALYIRMDPDVKLDFRTCKVEGFRSNMFWLGLGVENHGSHVPLTDRLTGKYQVGLRPAGCGSTLTAYPTWTRAYGTDLKYGFFHLNESTPAENNLGMLPKVPEQSAM